MFLICISLTCIHKLHIIKSNSLYNFKRYIAACSSEKFFIQSIKTDLFCSLTDFQHKITVQASPNLDKRRSLNSNSSSPSSSPTIIPRLRAIQCKSPLIWSIESVPYTYWNVGSSIRFLADFCLISTFLDWFQQLQLLWKEG